MLPRLAEQLSHRLAQPLPGRKAQSMFAPELSFGRHRGPPHFDARPAAVLALIFQGRDDWHIPLTLRPDHLPDHAGQVCFPGGMNDLDEGSEEAALRELKEELGVSPDDVCLLGKLSPVYVFASNFWVTPCIGMARIPPVFQPNPLEVSEIVNLSFNTLLSPTNYGSQVIERRGVCFHAPHIVCGRHRIWGATSMMLGELIAVLHDVYLSEALA